MKSLLRIALTLAGSAGRLKAELQTDCLRFALTLAGSAGRLKAELQTDCLRFALILAGSAAVPVWASAQTPGGMVVAPPAPAAVSTSGLGPRIQFNTENYDAGTNLAGEPDPLHLRGHQHRR